VKLTRVLVALALTLAVPRAIFARTLLPGEVVYVRSAVVDLNGNGKRENIRIDIEKGYGPSKYTLHVGRVSVKGRLSEGVDGFQIVDINSADGYKEIAVRAQGPSDWLSYHLYWYDGKRIRDLGQVPGGWAKFPGNGSVLVYRNIEEYTALVTEKYVLSADRGTLRIVPQEMYYLGTVVTVAKSFPIYYTRGSTQVVADLARGSRITILAYVPAVRDSDGKLKKGTDDEFLIKSQKGLLGWAKGQQIIRNIKDLPMAG
jgi:hypothetical protein